MHNYHAAAKSDAASLVAVECPVLGMCSSATGSPSSTLSLESHWCYAASASVQEWLLRMGIRASRVVQAQGLSSRGADILQIVQHKGMSAVEGQLVHLVAVRIRQLHPHPPMSTPDCQLASSPCCRNKMCSLGNMILPICPRPGLYLTTPVRFEAASRRTIKLRRLI